MQQAPRARVSRVRACSPHARISRVLLSRPRESPDHVCAPAVVAAPSVPSSTCRAGRLAALSALRHNERAEVARLACVDSRNGHRLRLHASSSLTRSESATRTRVAPSPAAVRGAAGVRPCRATRRRCLERYAVFAQISCDQTHDRFQQIPARVRSSHVPFRSVACMHCIRKGLLTVMMTAPEAGPTGLSTAGPRCL